MLAVNLTAFMASESPNEPTVLPPEYFATTHWTVVLAAQRSDSTRAHAALSSLCQAYWYPLYAFVRRQGHGPHDAQDLTQEFFSRLLSKNYLAVVARERGRFRSFLLGALKHFLANEWNRAQAAKRGGGQALISLNEVDAEGRYQLEPADTVTADKIFERRWATTLLDQVLNRLRDEYARAEKAALYERLKGCLTVESRAAPYAELATQLNMSEGAIKVAVHRLRHRYREVLREEIAQTVSTPTEVEEELRHLFAALAN
jgi:RNA polymerase sigma-70 factor (ECF subfamily)